MSTSLLYHAFGIKDYIYSKTEYKKGKVIFTIAHNHRSLKCSRCGSKEITLRGRKKRLFRTVPIGKKMVFIQLRIQRVKCHSCGKVRQVAIRFADPLLSYTKSFERYANDLSQHMSILDVARHLGVSWDIIKDIQKRYLKKHFGKPKLKQLKRIAIDEITIGKRHKYLTVVLDIESGAVVFIGDGKGAAALISFWNRLKYSGAKIEAVAIDMSPAYIEAVSTNLPGASIVFDHFHVIKYFNDKLSNFRRELQREIEDEQQKQVLKGTRWLILKNPEHLDEEHNEKERLDAALELNKPLATVYYMKEDLRVVWKQEDKVKAETFLDDWIKRARVSGISMLKNFANTLSVHKEGILAYYDFSISTGPLEGTNNKINTMKRQAYGFRDMEFFKLKIFAIHRTKYALVG
jgi:transposase